jgi:2-iminobutanoate/2-iminopropanoate deaminase
VKLAIALATAIFAMTCRSAAAAPVRPAVEHFPAPARPDGSAPPFSSAVRVGDVLYLAGQLGVAADGKLPDGIEAQTRLALDNVGAVLKRAGLGYADVFHCTAMLADMKDWPAMNTVYVTYFPEGKRPARSAFGTSGLALGGLIELECQAYAGKK